MNSPSAAGKRVVVIGGGITGLAAAHRLAELDPTLDVVLLEAGNRLGGVLETVQREGFLIERSADSFITNVPWAVDLCRRIGFAEQLIPTSSQQRTALVVRRGRLRPVPPGFMLMAPARLWPLVTTPILSPWGKLRLLCEYFVPPRAGDADESLASFARRRLGRETFERIVQPLVSGIYSADPEQLSLRATLPRFLEMERRWGSLIRGARREPSDGDTEAASLESGARYGMFVAPRDGLTSLVQAIAARLPSGSVRLDSPVERISRRPCGGWTVGIAMPGAAAVDLDCDALILAVGAPVAARMLAPVDRELADALRGIVYAGTAIVTLAFRRDQILRPLDGFGFVVPAVEQRRILAASFASVKFAGRAPHDTVLVRVFIGGACQSELLELPDSALQQIATEEMQSLLGTSGAPIFSEVTRWPHAMPQYHVGHCERVAAIERKVDRWPRLALAGNAYHGVGIPHCIHSGQQAAERVRLSLK